MANIMKANRSVHPLQDTQQEGANGEQTQEKPKGGEGDDDAGRKICNGGVSKTTRQPKERSVKELEEHLWQRTSSDKRRRGKSKSTPQESLCALWCIGNAGNDHAKEDDDGEASLVSLSSLSVPSTCLKKQVLEMKAGLVIPCPPHVAYKAFSDFSRHAEWDPNVSSVKYVDESRMEAEWTMETMGIQCSWRTIPTKMDPNRLIAWKSTKGLKLEVMVYFHPLVGKVLSEKGQKSQSEMAMSTTTTTTTTNSCGHKNTLMMMKCRYEVKQQIVPRKVKKTVRTFQSDHDSHQIKEILENFCLVIMQEQQAQQERYWNGYNFYFT